MSRDFQEAKWIWCKNDANEDLEDRFLLFRRDFELEEITGSVNLHITADSRYVVWLNGRRLGDGPVRGFPEEWFYDTYDVTCELHQGTNCVAVLVRRFGFGTYQYIPPPAPGGLLAELQITQDGSPQVLLATDNSWLVRSHPGYATNSSRITLQQPRSELFDARALEDDWMLPGVDLCDWEQSVEIGRAGDPPWTNLQGRNIPLLTDDTYYPCCVHPPEPVRVADQVWAFDLRPYLLPGRKDANRERVSALVATCVDVPEPVNVKLLFNCWVASRVVVNGQEMKGSPRDRQWFGGPRYDIRLSAGTNLLVFPIRGPVHDLTFNAIVKGQEDLEPYVPGSNGRFAVFPLSGDDELSSLQAARRFEELSDHPALRLVTREEEYPVHIASLVLASETDEGLVRTERLQALCDGSHETTVIHPDPDGKDIRLLCEFDRLVAGHLEFEVEAPADAILDFYGFEAYRHEGEIEYTWGVDNSLRYITKAGRQVYRSLQHRGLRYLILTVRNLRGPLKIRRLVCHLRTYPFPATGRFRCEDQLLNNIYDISRWTMRLCSDDTFVDCPTYEQAFWVGDAQIEGLVALSCTDAQALQKRCLRLAARSLHRSPLVESHVPSSWQDILTTWSFLWVLACDEYYLYTADDDFLEEIYPSILQQFHYCRDHLLQDDQLLWSPWWSVMDWAPVDTPASSAVTHVNALFVEAARRSAKMARLLGKEQDAEIMLTTAEEVAQAINRELWCPKRRAYVDCKHKDGRLSEVVSEQTNIFCYLCDIAEGDRKEILERYVSRPPENFIQVITPFTMFFKLEALQRLGLIDQALEAIRQTWGYMLEKNSTTCWESMPGWVRGRWTRSHCHAWSAAPAYFLPAMVLGVRPAEPGFRQVTIAPATAGLSWAEGALPTTNGPIKVRWEKQERRFEIEVHLPSDVAADITVPVPATLFMELEIEGQGLKGTKLLGGGHTHVLTEPGAELRIVATT